QKPRCMSGVGVAYRAQRFVIASDESRAGTHSRGSPADGQVQLEAKLHHGVRLVDFWIREALAAKFVKGLPRRFDDRLVLSLASGDIQQAEDDAAWIGAQEAVE